MSDLQTAKAVVHAFYSAPDHAAPSDAANAIANLCAPDLIWRGSHPFNEIIGRDQFHTS